VPTVHHYFDCSHYSEEKPRNSSKIKTVFLIGFKQQSLSKITTTPHLTPLMHSAYNLWLVLDKHRTLQQCSLFTANIKTTAAHFATI